MMLMAGFVFALMNVFVKLVPDIPPLEIAFFRSVISLTLILYNLRKHHIEPFGTNRKVLWLRGIFGSVGLIFFFYSLKMMPLATATVIHYSSPVFTSLIAVIVLKERLRFYQLLFFLISISGIFVIYGFDYRITTAGLIVGVMSAFGSGAAYNCIRWLEKSENPQVIMLYFPLVVLPVSIFMLSITSSWVMPTGWDWLFLLCIGLLTQLAQYGITVAYQHEAATRIAPISYAGVLYALFFGYMIFDESHSLKVYLGMALVLGGVLLSVFVKFPKKEEVQPD